MRIHHVIASVLEKYGGPSQSVAALCEALALRGHEVTLHVYAPAPEMPGRSYAIRTYRRAPLPFPLDLSRDLAPGLRAAARAGDVMHMHGLWRLVNVLPAWAVRGTGCKLVSSPRGMLAGWALQQSAGPKRLVWSLGQRRALAASDLLHATADAEATEIRAAGLPGAIAVVPNGVPIPPEAERATFDGDRRRLLLLGRIHPVKGIDRLVRAWASLQADFPAWDLHIVGPDDGGYQATLEALARELRAERVHFDGPAWGRAKDEQLQRAQLLVLPSHTENFGVSVAEALACGVPAVVGRGAPWSGLEREGCGLWTDNDPAPLAAALRSLLARPPAELRAMGERGRAWMVREYSWTRCAEMMERAYAWLLDPRGPPPDWVAPR